MLCPDWRRAHRVCKGRSRRRHVCPDLAMSGAPSGIGAPLRDDAPEALSRLAQLLLASHLESRLPADDNGEVRVGVDALQGVAASSEGAEEARLTCGQRG